jgi:hypothetical protein
LPPSDRRLERILSLTAMPLLCNPKEEQAQQKRHLLSLYHLRTEHDHIAAPAQRGRVPVNRDGPATAAKYKIECVSFMVHCWSVSERRSI